MPSYTYKCKSYEHEFTTEQSMNDAPLTECPECKGDIFRKIGKNVGISFVGSGFYVNDTKGSPSES